MEKERRAKALLLSTLVVVVATLSIAFAAMSRTLSINGIAKMDTASWSVYFDNLSKAQEIGEGEEISAPKINESDNGIVEGINVKLHNPGDEVKYTVEIVNDGTIDAEITMLELVELTEAQAKVFEFTIKYSDGTELQNGDLLRKGETKTVVVSTKFKDNILASDLPTEALTINLSFRVTYTQYDEEDTVTPEIPDDDVIVRNQSILDHEWAMTDELGDVAFEAETVTFLDHVNVPSVAQDTVMDVSYEKNNSILAWYYDSDSNGVNEIYVGSNDEIVLYIDEETYQSTVSDDINPYAYYFGNLMSAKTIIFNNNVNTSRVINMSRMFECCFELEELDLSSWDTSNVTDMAGMFSGFSFDMPLDKLKSINLDGWNTSKVTNMSEMFKGCILVGNLDLSSFDTSNVTDMSNMFGGCSSLTNLDLSSFDTSNVTDMHDMFSGCSSLTSLDVTNFNTTNVTNMSSVFEDCTSLTNLDLSTWDTSKVTTMCKWSVAHFGMFEGCTSLTQIKFNSAIFTSVTDYDRMFANVPNNFTIYVKDQAAKNFILGIRSDANVIIEPLSS